MNDHKYLNNPSSKSTMFTEEEEDEERDCRKILIVVLDGSRVLWETVGVSPLQYALQQVVKPEDQVVVLVIFNSTHLIQSYSPVISNCCIGSECRNDEDDKERYIRVLREEISQGTEAYMRIFRPFYKECKSIGVKFTVKIVVGSTLDAIVLEERNNSGATSVVIGRGFAMDNRPWITQKRWKLSSQNDDDEVLLYTCKPPGEVSSESSRVENAVFPAQKASRFKKKTSSQHNDHEKPIYCTLPNFEGIYQPSSSSSSIATTSESSRETDTIGKFKDPTENTTQPLENNMISASNELGFPVELSWEVISEITNQFSSIIHLDSNEAFQMYSGYLGNRPSPVFVKRYIGIEYNYVLKAEKKAALTMYHKNIIGLVGFHQNETAMALVFPYASRGSLMDRFLNGFWTKELEVPFPCKMNIAIGIAQGLRYMHEQCPRGPIVHGDLRPCNILLGHNLQPQITGFGHAKWLQFEQSSPTSSNSCGHKHPSDPNSLALMKADILAFGLLLLRLFCNRSAPRDDKSLLTWARPLLEQGAYHVLYDESEYDFHGLFVVTSAAARSISTRPKSRPCMTKVLSLLKGEISCAKQTFPSTESSPSMALTPLALQHMSIDV